MAEVLTYRENQIGGCVTIITAEVDGKTHPGYIMSIR